MIQAFYTGVSGIASHQNAIDVTADNLANINSVGYRAYQAEFSDVFSDSLAAPSIPGSIDNSIGMGSFTQATSLNLSQGSLLKTEHTTDLAILGDGWFGIESGNERYFTRAGNFTFDTNRDLVTPEGMFVLGTLGNNIDQNTNTLTKELSSVPLGNVTQQQKLRLPKELHYPAQPTSNIDFYGNLGTSDETRVISAIAIDKEGNKNKIKLTFTLDPTQPETGSLWNVKATATNNDSTITYDSVEGSVSFDETGALVKSTLPPIDNNGSSVTLNLGNGYAGVIAAANIPISGSSNADGLDAGELIGYDINQDAEIIATFSNGRQSSVAKVALFHFQNDQGLERISGTLFSQSSNSGKAIFFQDQNGNNILGANVVTRSLESSNIKMEEGLTELIVYQRAYDANAKSITTADQMIQKALNMDA